MIPNLFITVFRCFKSDKQYSWLYNQRVITKTSHRGRRDVKSITACEEKKRLWKIKKILTSHYKVAIEALRSAHLVRPRELRVIPSQWKSQSYVMIRKMRIYNSIRLNLLLHQYESPLCIIFCDIEGTTKWPSYFLKYCKCAWKYQNISSTQRKRIIIISFYMVEFK